MIEALGRFAVHRRWAVLSVAALLVVLGAVWGAGAGQSLGAGAGLDNPNGESARANALLAGPLGAHSPDVLVLYDSPDLTVDDPAYRERVEAVAARLPAESYNRLETYWSTGSSDFVSADRHKTYLILQLAERDEIRMTEVFGEQLAAGLFDAPGLTERFGGLTASADQFFAITDEGLARAELLSLPLLLVLLLVVFRSVVAAALPMAIAVLVAVGSLAVLRAVGAVVPLSTSAINVVIILGLGLATDYALLVVSRFREELAAGRGVDAAVVRAVATAGRTVVVSGVTVAITLFGLLIFPSRFLQSLAWSGTSVVLFAAAGAVTVLPALLSLVGRRVDALRVPLPWGRRPGRVSGSRWYRTAHAVMRRPVAVTVGITAVLVTMGLPLLGAVWSRPAEWALPPDTDSRVVAATLAAEFPRDPTKVITAVVRMPGPVDTAPAGSVLDDYAQRLDALPGVDGAQVTGTYADLARITVGYSPLDPYGAQVREVVADLRAEPVPPGAEAMFTQRPASITDMLEMLAAGLPWLLAIVVVVTFGVLFLAFGSVVLPIRTVLTNMLSLGAAMGTLVLVFQHGVLADLLGVQPSPYLDANFPVLIAAAVFGLAMDYEVFLLARMHEHYRRTGDHTEAVAVGVAHTARLVTSAALLLGVVVGAFIVVDVSVVQMLGVGVVVALVLDATVVRGLLVPATMGLLGRRAWWAPRPLARWWARHSTAHDDAGPAVPDPVPAHPHA